MSTETMTPVERKADLATENAMLRKGLGDLMHAYVNLLEIGRDSIIRLGGTCDSVDVMEAGDPALRSARATLARRYEKNL